MKRLASALLVALLCLGAASGEAEGLMDFFSRLFSGSRALSVGTDVAFGDITDFYYTFDASTFPPEYQRYRFYVEDGQPFFFHETREGDHWPLTEADATASGTAALTEDQWAAFCACVEGGTVSGRTESYTTGDSGPWTYLYWRGDRGDIQAFEFASSQARKAFEALCAELAGEDTEGRG